MGATRAVTGRAMSATDRNTRSIPDVDGARYLAIVIDGPDGATADTVVWNS